jgi:hypothetical protein
MKYGRYERDARAFGWPPAFFMSIEHERAHGYASDKQRLREESARDVVRAWRCQRRLNIAVSATVAAAAVAVAALLL